MYNFLQLLTYYLQLFRYKDSDISLLHRLFCSFHSKMALCTMICQAIGSLCNVEVMFLPKEYQDINSCNSIGVTKLYILLACLQDVKRRLELQPSFCKRLHNNEEILHFILLFVHV